MHFKCMRDKLGKFVHSYQSGALNLVIRGLIRNTYRNRNMVKYKEEKCD